MTFMSCLSSKDFSNEQGQKKVLTLNTILGSLAVLRTGVPDYPPNCWHVTSVNSLMRK